jgi:uncharacterized protein YggE
VGTERGTPDVEAGMNRTIVLAAGGGALAAALIAVGVLAAVDDGTKSAVAQNPTTTVATGSPGVARTITVDGIGRVSGTPDTASLTLGVQVQAPTAAEALNTASAKAQTLIDTLTGAGVGKADIQTGNVSVYPNYKDMGTVAGYWASNSVTATVHDVANAGAVIDAAANAVGDGITLGGVWFSIDDTSGLYAQARAIAVGEARTRAEQLAKAANVSVGAVVAMNESAQYYPSPVAYDGRDSGGAATTTVPVMAPIEPGSQNLQLSVQVVFELIG